MARPTFDRDKAIRVLLDAMHLGDEGAAKLHKISRRSVINYRKRIGDAPELAQAFAAEKKANQETWREQLSETQRFLLGRVKALAEKSDNLFHVSGALKIVSDASNAERSIDLLAGGDDGGLGVDGAQRDQPGEAHSQAPRRALSILTGGKPTH